MITKNDPGERNEPSITVLISTLNRGRKLIETLESIARCANPGVPLEVIVVDNGSTDDTADQVQRFAAHCALRMRYLHEPRRGKSRALQSGLGEAGGSWIAFTDDDVKVDPDWLTTMVSEIREMPDAVLIGGRVEPFDDASAGATVRTSRERARVTRAGYSILNTPIIGCNMCARRNLLEELQGFDQRLGPGSRHGLVAEDVDLLYRAVSAGHTLLYSPDMVVYHDHGRTDPEAVRRSRIGYLKGRGALYAKHARRDRDLRRSLFWELSSLLRIPKLAESRRWLGSLETAFWLLAGAALYPISARQSGR